MHKSVIIATLNAHHGMVFCRLKLNYLIKDDTGIAAVSFWDKQARQLINKTATELLAELPEVYLCLHIIIACIFIVVFVSCITYMLMYLIMFFGM